MLNNIKQATMNKLSIENITPVLTQHFTDFLSKSFLDNNYERMARLNRLISAFHNAITLLIELSFNGKIKS